MPLTIPPLPPDPAFEPLRRIAANLDRLRADGRRNAAALNRIPLDRRRAEAERPRGLGVVALETTAPRS